MDTKTITRAPLLEIFIFLQVLDVLTTLTALRLGAQEINPFIRQMMATVGNLEALLVCKIAVVILAAIVLWHRKARVIVTVNYLFACLIVWNLTQLLKAPIQG